ncbi:MAG: GAF domain-containing sensor histidine kinase [Firmicutes bacterium]|nr:GAF domain-containing sensor histidine kinase [Bacillota bacterium]
MPTSKLESKPKLILICQISPTFKIGKALEFSLQRTLQTSIDSFEFWQAGLILVRKNKPPAYWHTSKTTHEKQSLEKQKNADRWSELYNSVVTQKKGDAGKFIDALNPVTATTLPVILNAGEPIATMEIGIFDTDARSAQYMLVKAVSLGRHIADILQESFFQKQKDHNLRKLAVWLEMVNTISSTLDIRQVLHVVAQLTADLFSAKSCIYLLDEEKQTLIPAVAVGSYDPDLRKHFRALRGTKPFPAIARAIKTQRPVQVTPHNIEELLTPDIISKFKYDRMVLVPIMIKNKTIGVMQLDRPLETTGFDSEETEIIFAAARATAIALENARLIEELGQKEQLLHKLVKKIIAAQEDERKRLAADLHDGIIQSLIAIWYRLQRVTPASENDPEKWYEEISDLTKVLNEQIQDIRRILYDLRPIILDNYGLLPAVESYVQNLQDKHNLPVELTTKGKDCRLPAEVEITLFRILQEALTNVMKHAHATQVKVELIILNEEVSLAVKDNGAGLDTSLLSMPQFQNRLGLASIQERALLLNGICDIESQPGKGTRIFVKIPLSEYEKQTTPQSQGGFRRGNKTSNCR